MKTSSNISVTTLTVGPIQACCYIVTAASQGTGKGTKGANQAFLIDPGGDGPEIVSLLKKRNLDPLYLINTHGHIDHIGANQDIKKFYPDTTICIHQDDARMLTSASANLSPELGYQFTSPAADKLLKENDVLSINNDTLAVKVIHLPGHTRGGIGLLYEPADGSRPVLFTGDTLFAGGVGRTDFPGGSMKQLIDNIKLKILTLADDTLIYPGHGPASTVGDEKAHNQFLTGSGWINE
jgi:hydroxyacylglutathione hydrolase